MIAVGSRVTTTLLLSNVRVAKSADVCFKYGNCPLTWSVYFFPGCWTTHSVRYIDFSMFDEWPRLELLSAQATKRIIDSHVTLIKRERVLII